MMKYKFDPPGFAMSRLDGKARYILVAEKTKVLASGPYTNITRGWFDPDSDLGPRITIAENPHVMPLERFQRFWEMPQPIYKGKS